MFLLNKTFSIFAGQKRVAKPFGLDPTLYRDFVLDKQLNGTIGRFGPNISFSRNSQATFFNVAGNIETIAVNTPRFEYSPSTQYQGLLIEEQRTNLIQRSNTFTNGSTWFIAASSGGLGVTLTTASINSPDGTLNATKMTDTSAVGFHTISWIPGTLADGEYYDRSIFVKNDTARYLILGCAGTPFEGNVYTTYDFQLSSFPENIPFDKVYAEPMKDGWLRIGFLRDSALDNTNTNRILVGIAKDDETVLHTTPVSEINKKSIYIWGAQAELGLHPTSYIPTNGQQVTRAADNAYVGGLNFIYLYNKQGGSFTVKANYNYPLTQNIYSSFTNIEADQYWSFNKEINSLNALAVANFTNTIFLSAPATQPKTFNTFTVGISNQVYSVYLNQTLVNSATSIALPTVVSEFQLGRKGDIYLNGHIQKFGYWPRLLSAIDLQTQ